ncbi:MAG: hypothetical protein P1V35_01215 [Planctomycetota bacterium]|nr:hypothetical protein [Planctomycetota bacterium]
MAKKEAEEGAKEDGEEGDGTPKKKSPIKLVGALVAVVGMGAALAVMAIPSGPKETPRFVGPFFHDLVDKDVVTNTKDDHFKRFVKYKPQVEFFAYDAEYINSRMNDQLYTAWLTDSFSGLASNKSINDIMAGANRERFAQVIRHAIEPVLFPVHIGSSDSPLDLDPESGIRPGDSYRLNTFRGSFWNHTLTIDGEAKTLTVDEGDATPFLGDELDLKVMTPSGDWVYLDVTSMEPGFSGTVQIGVKGRIRQVFVTNMMAQ